MITEKIVYRLVYLVAACVLVAGIAATVAQTHEPVQQTVLQQGSQGDLVKQMQQRLKTWGYYTGSVDGVFGTGTKAAVLYFQRKNGLSADGKVGPQTLAALGISEGKVETSTNSATVNLLAHLIYGEARGESYQGQVAIGGVIMNRVKHPSFPNTVTGVIYQPGAFTAVSDGQINLAPNDTAYRAARDTVNGVDPSGGAIYYYNPKTATNQWIRSRPIVKVIGLHVFCK